MGDGRWAMTEYELVDVLISYNTAALSAMALYLTTVSSYLIVAYLTGKNLATSQVVMISVLFIVFALLFGYAAFGYMRRGLLMADELRTMNPGEFVGINPWIVFLGTGLLFAGILASLQFMWEIRHPKSE
jgi:hypothetical protein